ncbi:MAG: 4-hydroxy-tetrahydrodipicolinate reductase [Planctomycetaceae bacterium]|nr:4-hydroxy-tetrahydrodipicolinate reductase [Planctomycetaceae bacterium]
MSTPIHLGVTGAAGRMGQRVIALAAHDRGIKLAGAYESPQSPRLGQDAGEVASVGRLSVLITDSVAAHVDVIIDFSTPDGSVAIARVCEERRIPLVVATTGLNPEQRAVIATAAQVTPVLMAPSMSYAVNLAMKLVGDAGRVLKQHPQGVDVEIIERHHRFKEDAPSGTALKFGEIVAQSMGQDRHVHGREGRTGQRPPNEIGYHALRTGDNVGEHTIVFGLIGETLEITVRGQSRDSYALGALAAAKYLVTQQAGLYSMSDVLGL